MVKRTNVYVVGLTAVEIAVVNPRRTSLIIMNNSVANTVYIGTESSITTGSALPLPAGGSLALNMGLGDEPWLGYYAIAAAAGNDVRTIEQFGTRGGV